LQSALFRYIISTVVLVQVIKILNSTPKFLTCWMAKTLTN